jgi:AcrR family transcriptional regulator
MARPTLTSSAVNTLRAKVCEVASGLFSAHGVENVGLRMIASEIDLTGAALYRYFPQGRDEIVAAVRAKAFKELADLSEAAFDSAGTPLERFRAVAEAYLAFARQDAAAYRMLFSLMQTGDFPELRREARRARDILFRAAQEVAQSEEPAREGRVLAHVAWAAIHGAVMLATSEMLQMGVDIEQLMDSVAQALSHLSEAPIDFHKRSA